MNIIFLGPPGSGKSTQAELLARALDLYFIQMGREVRKAAKLDSPWGKKIKAQMEKGALVEDESIKKILQKIIHSRKTDSGFVLDGAPRIISQVDEIENFVKETGKKIDKVILVKVDDQKCLKRLLKRGRMDDTPEVIKKRLKTYHCHQDAVIDYYRQKGILEEVNGEREIETIFQDILKRLDYDSS